MKSISLFLLVIITYAVWPSRRAVSVAEQAPDVSLDLRHGWDGAFFTDMNHGYVFGDNALIATNDGGASWRLVRDVGIASVFFLDGQRFWILSGGGQLHATSDAGGTLTVGSRTFRDTQTGRDRALCGQLSFLDPGNGWSMCGADVLKTIDGGQTWTASSLPRELSESYRIHMFSAQEGIAVERLHAVIRTTDGGLTWTAVPNSPKLEEVSCTAAGFCAALGSRHGPVFASSDRGQSWKDTKAHLQLPDRDELAALQALGPTLIVAAGSDTGRSYEIEVRPFLGTRTPPPRHGPPRALLLTYDGSTWTRFTHNEPREFGGLYFVDAQHGWLTGIHENLIYKTTDGGQTLQFVPDYFRQIAALTPSPAPLVIPTPATPSGGP